MTDEARIADEAAAWHAASLGDQMDWDQFTNWLAADDRHRLAYDQVALADDLLSAHPQLLDHADIAPLPENVVPIRPRQRWPLWLGGAVAASLAALMVAGQVIPPAAQDYATNATAQTIALADGSSVVLAPRSRLTVAGRDGAQLALEGGAYFDIRHRPDRSLEITAGGLTVTDIGTRFEIRQQDAAVLVEVAEGQVTAKAPAMARAVQLGAGKRLQFDPAAGRAAVSSVAVDDVAAWRQGRLTYDAAPLQLVAGDLARYAGVRVEIPQALGQRRFSGSLFIGDGDAAVRDLAELMQLRLRRDGAVWRLEPAG